MIVEWTWKKVAKTKQKNCCKDEIFHIEGQDELQQFSYSNFDLEKQQFVVAFYQSYQELFVKKIAKKINANPVLISKIGFGQMNIVGKNIFKGNIYEDRVFTSPTQHYPFHQRTK